MKRDVMFLPETIIDTHCHGRDMNEFYKTTVEQTLREAKSGNIGITVFMLNTDPPIIDRESLVDHLFLFRRATTSLDMQQGQQRLYFGVTDNNLDWCKYALKNFAIFLAFLSQPGSTDIA